MRRYALRNDQWDGIKDFFPAAKVVWEARRRTIIIRICSALRPQMGSAD
jgi:hypothetical protein